MIQIPRVQAYSYHREMCHARTHPGLFVCRIDDGTNFDFVVKFRSRLGGRILCEFFAALLGERLGLPVPPIAIVEIDPRLVACIPDPQIRSSLAEDRGPHFGSLFRSGGYLNQPVEFSLPKTMVSQAVDVFAFDMLIQNPDRTFITGRGKPNVLMNEERLIVFDHELAFSFVDAIGPQPAPWTIRPLEFVKYHMFYSLARRCAADDNCVFDRFIARLETLAEDWLTDVVNAIPDDWRNPRITDKIALHLTTIRENRLLFERGLREALA